MIIAMEDVGERWTTVVFHRPSTLCRQSRRKDGGGLPNGYGGDGPPLGTVAVVLPPSVDDPPNRGIYWHEEFILHAHWHHMISELHGWDPVFLEYMADLGEALKALVPIRSRAPLATAKLANIRPLALEKMTAENALTAAKRWRSDRASPPLKRRRSQWPIIQPPC